MPDLSAYFVYQNAGDQIDVAAAAAAGEVSGSVGTEVTADGGTAPAEARAVLQPTPPTSRPRLYLPLAADNAPALGETAPAATATGTPTPQPPTS